MSESISILCKKGRYWTICLYTYHRLDKVLNLFEGANIYVIIAVMKTEICAIVAIGPDNVIGRNGVMPWYCPADYYHFRKTTIPYPCIFGRTTFENLPVKPLPYRFNLVCSSQYKNEYRDDVFYADSVESALICCENFSRVFICGGAQIYKYAFDRDLIDTFYLTIIKNQILDVEINKNPGAYCRFPIDASVFLNSPKWHSQPIVYPVNELPRNANNTTAEFFMCNRVR